MVSNTNAANVQFIATRRGVNRTQTDTGKTQKHTVSDIKNAKHEQAERGESRTKRESLAYQRHGTSEIKSAVCNKENSATSRIKKKPRVRPKPGMSKTKKKTIKGTKHGERSSVQKCLLLWAQSVSVAGRPRNLS